MDQNSSLGKKFDLNSESGVSVVLASIRASELPSAKKNELRDLVFQYTNRGGDVEVKATLEKKLSAYEVEPVRLKEAFKVQNIVFPFGSARPSPVFKSVTVDQASSPVQLKSEVAKPVDEVKTESSKPDEVATQAEARPTPEVDTESATVSSPEPVSTPAPVSDPNPSPVSDQATSSVENTPTAPTQTPSETTVKETPISQPSAQPQTQTQPVTPSPDKPQPEAVQTAPVSTPNAPGGDRLERIRQIKQAVNAKVGNPVNLIDIDNNVGREYMASLLDAMKKLNQGNASEMDKAMVRLETSYRAVEVAVDNHNNPVQNPAVASQVAVASKPTDQTAPQQTIQQPAQTPASTPTQNAVPPSASVQVRSEGEDLTKVTPISQSADRSEPVLANTNPSSEQGPRSVPSVSNDQVTPPVAPAVPQKTEVPDPNSTNTNLGSPSPVNPNTPETSSPSNTPQTPQTPQATPSVNQAVSGLASIKTASRPSQSVPPSPKPIAGFSNLASSLNNGQTETGSQNADRQPAPETPTIQRPSANTPPTPTPQAPANTQIDPTPSVAERNASPLASNSPNIQQDSSVSGASLANNFTPQVPSQAPPQTPLARPAQPETEHESLVEKATHFAENLASNLGLKHDSETIQASPSVVPNSINNTISNNSVNSVAQPSPLSQPAQNAVPDPVRPLSQTKELLTPEDLPKTKQDISVTENIPLYSKEIDYGLEQLLLDWSLFNKSGLFGTGPKGREHPLFKTLAPLEIPVILAGRFEGSTQEVKQSITDYMNGWRYEQGIIYDKDETFETYLRRVIKHILDLQRKQKAS